VQYDLVLPLLNIVRCESIGGSVRFYCLLRGSWRREECWMYRQIAMLADCTRAGMIILKILDRNVPSSWGGGKEIRGKANLLHTSVFLNIATIEMRPKTRPFQDISSRQKGRDQDGKEGDWKMAKGSTELIACINLVWYYTTHCVSCGIKKAQESYSHTPTTQMNALGLAGRAERPFISTAECFFFQNQQYNYGTSVGT